MKKKFGIVLIIIVTISCIFLGIKTREKNAIVVTQIQTNLKESLSYMIETQKNNIIMIDGGSPEDSQHLEKILLDKGGVVDTWFITIAHQQNFGALQEILKNGNIEVNHIYLSFNTGEWYAEYEPDRVQKVLEFSEVLSQSDMMGKVQEVENRFEISIDNLYLTALNVKNPDLNENYAGFNQSMVIKVNNTYKSMIFMGNIANEAAQKFKDNNLDEIECDAVQVSNNGMQFVDNEVYQKMMPQYLFISVSDENELAIQKDYIENLKILLKAKESYQSSDGDRTVRIW